MDKIRRLGNLRAVFFAIVIIALTTGAPAVFAQNAVSLDAEIQSVEKTAFEKGAPAVQRHEALVRLARLRQLSGDIEGAAKNWLEAAAAIPGSVDDDALLSCAYCLAAMGEWDRASAALHPLLEKSARARFLDISMKAIKTGDVSMLSAIANVPEYSQMKSQIFFMLWKTSRAQAAEIWRQRLAEEFPQSPEGRLASGENTNAVIIKPSPFWLFMGSLELQSESAAENAPVQTSQPQIQTPQAQTPQAQTPQTPAPQASKPPASAQTVKLQTGLYSLKDNAQTQIAKLEKAGFSPTLEQRGDKWAVIVSSGADANRTIRELKSAGFDSFPLK